MPLDFSNEEIEEEIAGISDTIKSLKADESQKPRAFIRELSCPKGITLNSQITDLLSILDEDISESAKDKKIVAYISSLKEREEKINELRAKGRIELLKYMLNEALGQIPGLTNYEKRAVERIYIDSLPTLEVCDAKKIGDKLSDRGLSRDIHRKIFKLIAEKETFAKEGILELTPQKVRALYNHMFKDGNTYDRVTLDNVGKYSGFVALDGKTYTPKKMDKMVAFCEKHGMKVKVNTLLFYLDFPKDLESSLDYKVSIGEMTEEQKRAKIKECLFSYVKALGKRYGDKIDSVDIFNELICDPDMKEPGFDEDTYGQEPRVYHMREKGWFKYLSFDDLCEFALAARKAMPNVTFTYNDMNWVTPEKRKEIIKIIKQIKKKEQEYRESGILGKEEKGLIDIIGLEAHLSADVDIEELTKTLDDVDKEIGLPMEITELDICKSINNSRQTRDTFAQNGMLRKIIQFVDEGRISSVTVWSQSDEMSFLNRIIGKNVQASVILDGNCEEKKLPFDKDSIAIEQEVLEDREKELPLQDFNYHTHTALCGHAEGEMEDYIIASMKAGMQAMGFSDHTPTPFSKENPKAQMTMEQFENVYIPRLQELREKYKDKIDIKIGIETEYLGDEVERLSQIRPKRKKIEEQLDYQILGQHLAIKRTKDGKFLIPYAMSDPKSASYPMDYAYAVVEGIKSKRFLYVAHPDIFMEHRFDIPKSEREKYNENVAKATEMICQAAIEYDIPLEVNMGAVASTKAGMKKIHLNQNYEYEYDYPVLDFWKVAASKGCKVVVGIDAHHPDAIMDRTEEAVFKKRLERNGIQLKFIELDELWKNGKGKKQMSEGQGDDEGVR